MTNKNTCEICECGDGSHLYTCSTLNGSDKMLEIQMEISEKHEGVYAFRGEFRFLSNFWPCEVFLDCVQYPTVEHADQAAKAFLQEDKHKIKIAKTAAAAKKLGSNLTNIPKNWEEIKLGVMDHLLRQKFVYGSELHEKLCAIKGDIIEGNYWHDVWWGCCACENHAGQGENNLGKLLMNIRNENTAFMLTKGNKNEIK